MSQRSNTIMNIVYFLKPLEAAIIVRILSDYKEEIKAAEKRGDLRMDDLIATNAIDRFAEQTNRQFNDKHLADMKHDMKILEALNYEK
ncbi:hypothetical protein ACH3O9_11225 [Leeuwenhoekiella sp. A16]|uniref:hypothetical protein n=1 Tax=Leeuwenhoekiella sp. A16 TaxID=3141462 RepID=UPI003A7FA225